MKRTRYVPTRQKDSLVRNQKNQLKPEKIRTSAQLN